MIILRNAAAAAISLFVASCATMPSEQVTVSGALPIGHRYAVVQADKLAPPLALAGIEACLQAVGMASGTPAQAMVQVAHALRPARSMVLHVGEDGAPRGPKPNAKRDREELALTVTDRSSGALLWRGAVLRTLGKAEMVGDGTALVAPLCAAIKAPPAAGQR